jgi:predicted transglutaminase-like cysteine proteinase
MIVVVVGHEAAQASFFGLPRTLGEIITRIRLDEPALAPIGHTRFCMQYPEECTVRRLVFRGGPIDMTAERWKELVAVNAEVNRSIAPVRNTGGLMTEQWRISPVSGECNSYAVTKRHELHARGWPARALLLAEVVTSWGEHHLVLVVRTRQGDFVADNLNANIRPWSKTNYQWVRIQTPDNPNFWARVGTARNVAS